MSNLVTVPKNGRIANKNRNITYPTWSSWIDDLFGVDETPWFSRNFNNGITTPKVNIKETTDSYIVEMAIPGMKKSDFEISIENKILSISAEIENKKEETTNEYSMREFGFSSFKRSFSLPETVDDAKINANYTDGILNVHIPKKEEAKQKPARTIKIS
jgi:HSP20 family protein